MSALISSLILMSRHGGRPWEAFDRLHGGCQVKCRVGCVQPLDEESMVLSLGRPTDTSLLSVSRHTISRPDEKTLSTFLSLLFHLAVRIREFFMKEERKKKNSRNRQVIITYISCFLVPWGG